MPGGAAAAAVAASGVPGGAAPRRSSRNSAPRAVAGHGVRTTRPGGGGLKIVGLPPHKWELLLGEGAQAPYPAARADELINS